MNVIREVTRGRDGGVSLVWFGLVIFGDSDKIGVERAKVFKCEGDKIGEDEARD